MVDIIGVGLRAGRRDAERHASHLRGLGPTALAIAAFALACAWVPPAGAAQVSLAWDASPSPAVTGYYVHYGTASGGYPNRVAVGNATTYTLQNLAAGQQYFIAVTAHDAAFTQSGFSNEVSATPPAIATSATTLASSANSSVAGVAVAFTATVTGSAPTGTVNFRDGSTSIAGCAAVSLSGSGNTRTAVCSTTALGVGSHPITAVYGGNAGNSPSTSAAVVHVVMAATATALASSTNPSVVGAGVTLAATVTGSAPAGPVEFRAGGSPIVGCASVALTGSGNVRTAACSTSGLGVGTHGIVATYAGNATNTPSASGTLLQFVHATPAPSTFADVPVEHWAHAAIEAMATAGITLGCATSPRQFCPESIASRAEVAVFVERTLRGSAFVYSPTGTHFEDVPITHWAVGPIEQFAADGITSGCSTSPPLFCPADSMTRGSMAKLLLRAKLGAGFLPGTASGTLFTDVPADHWAAAWIEAFYGLGYTAGCGVAPMRFCPDAALTRAEMAVFLYRVFALPDPP